MQKYRFLLTTLGALALSALASRAGTTYLDYDLINQELNSNNPTYSGSFNIVTADDASDIAGYNPATQTIVSADAFFDVIPTTQGESARLKISLGPANNWVGPTTFNLESLLGGDVKGQVLLDLKADGIVDYTVTWKRGDFELVAASLGAEAVNKRVPDAGSTLVLLGSALTGLLAVSRKFKSC